MTLEESREVIPMMESMINQIEEQQNLMAEMVQELQERDQTASVFSGAEQEFTELKQRIIRAAESFARYRRTALTDRATENQNRTVGNRESAMAGINAEAEQREQLIAETEQRIADLKQQIEKAREIDERMQ